MVIYISGLFYLKMYADFSQSYKGELESVSKVVIDMAEVEHLDSSALDRVLLLRERAEDNGAVVDNINCSPGILKISATAKFGDLFKIQ